MIVPYPKKLLESFKSIHSKHEIKVYFKEGNTIKNLLVVTKDKDTITQKSGMMYRYKCDKVECNEAHIGEYSRCLGKDFKKTLKPPSPIYEQWSSQ